MTGTRFPCSLSFVLAALALNAFRLSFPKSRPRAYVTLAAGLSLLYAFSDETHQLFVPGREGKLTDVGIDAIGIAIGVIVVHLISKRNGTKKTA
jgi:VanZ family protein